MQHWLVLVVGLRSFGRTYWSHIYGSSSLRILYHVQQFEKVWIKNAKLHLLGGYSTSHPGIQETSNQESWTPYFTFFLDCLTVSDYQLRMCNSTEQWGPGLIWLQIETHCRLLWTWWWTCEFHTMQENFLAAEKLIAFQEPWSMKLVN
jgi:hypothetical protein